MIRYALISLILPIAAFADDPFACVDSRVVDAFVNHWHEEAPRYSTSLPAKAAALNLPADLEFVGSKLSGSNMTVAYTSDQPTKVAFASSLESLEAAGWKPLSEHNWHGGFQTRAVPMSSTLCHGSEPESMSVTAKEHPESALLLISLYAQESHSQVCRRSAEPRTWITPLQKYLPILDTPAGARASRNGSGGGDDEYSANITLSTTMSRDDLLQYFDDQIRAQGWVADSGWSGSSTVGTVWTRPDPKGQPLIGTMRIATARDGVFHARFTVISMEPDNLFEGHSSSSSS
jgi:hypothetical protein